jgi:hypothetical protein
VYGRALSTRELQVDETHAVSPAPGLVAGYAFDSGATDDSGGGHPGEPRGVTWTDGRHGRAARFDGAASLVRVPPSDALDLTGAMTLSAWVRPDGRQDDWRTIVQRQTDAYFLAAGTSRLNSYGFVDDLRAALVVLAAAWLTYVAAVRGRRRWWPPVALFVAGSIADALLAPSGTLIAVLTVATWLAATARHRIPRVTLALCALACAGVTVAVLAAGDGLSHNDGATARSTALGALLVLATSAEVAAVRIRSSFDEPPSRPLRSQGYEHGSRSRYRPYRRPDDRDH